MKKLIERIERHPIRIVGIIAIGVIVIHFAFKIPCSVELLQAEWEAGDALTFWGSCISFAGTFLLGIVAYAQNERANSIAEKMMNFEKERRKEEQEKRQEEKAKAKPKINIEVKELTFAICPFEIKNTDDKGRMWISLFKDGEGAGVQICEIVLAIQNLSKDSIRNIKFIKFTFNFCDGNIISFKPFFCENIDAIKEDEKVEVCVAMVIDESEQDVFSNISDKILLCHFELQLENNLAALVKGESSFCMNPEKKIVKLSTRTEYIDNLEENSNEN